MVLFVSKVNISFSVSGVNFSFRVNAFVFVERVNYSFFHTVPYTNTASFGKNFVKTTFFLKESLNS